ncbi:MAG TPA: iron uptake transporter deferrochelatase/peroxidase subunit [Trebonia sp.]|nr:iron uptake transporter deferrochelatase/peroxidase subunit [Trebonia sp.]
MASKPGAVSRRSFLKGTATGVAGTAVAGGAAAGIVAASSPGAGAAVSAGAVAAAYPFYGPNQAGILTPDPARKQAASCVAAFDVTAAGKSDLAVLLQTLTGAIAALTAGRPPAYLGIGQPPADSDVLGPAMPADGLTVTVGVGASLFDARYGLAARRPARLTTMPVFPDDAPEPAWTGGDLSLQVCANNADAVHHATRLIMKHTRDWMQLRWKMHGYASPARPSGASRNLLGFKDGTANPAGSLATSLVWIDDPAEPAWARGGSYQVVRLIRMLVEFWDRVSLSEQENMFGRRRDSGAPLDGSAEADVPDYAADPAGTVIPLDAHIRLANPRTTATAPQRLIRRSYNYDLGVDVNGNMQAGHVFLAYQQDVERQFATVQRRLAGEPLVDYVQPFGGGYFFVLPGVRSSSGWFGQGLLT